MEQCRAWAPASDCSDLHAVTPDHTEAYDLSLLTDCHVGQSMAPLQQICLHLCLLPPTRSCINMKFKVIERSLDDTLPARLGAPAPQHRNLDPALHPFAKAREYTRALTAAKMDKMFAKPFVDSLEGHNDGVYCMSRDPDRLGTVASGAGDGGKFAATTSAQIRHIERRIDSNCP